MKLNFQVRDWFTTNLHGWSRIRKRVSSEAGQFVICGKLELFIPAVWISIKSDCYEASSTDLSHAFYFAHFPHALFLSVNVVVHLQAFEDIVLFKVICVFFDHFYKLNLIISF